MPCVPAEGTANAPLLLRARAGAAVAAGRAAAPAAFVPDPARVQTIMEMGFTQVCRTGKQISDSTRFMIMWCNTN